MDHHLGLIRNCLSLHGLDEKTLFIITADHGEEFGEHGNKYHAKHLYEEVLQVPLIISSPANLPSNVSIPNQVRSIDIVPTILELLGIPPLASHQGESLLPLLNHASAPERPAISQIGGSEEGELVSLNSGEYKLIWDKKNNTHELYHLSSDPEEKNNIAEKDEEKLREAQAQLKDILQPPKERPFHYKPKKLKLDEELLARLRGLGYVE